MEELLHRPNSFTTELKKNLAAGSEHRILSFLKDDVYPVFEHLKGGSEELKGLIDSYDNLLDPELHSLRKELTAPVEIASFILVYSTPLSVHFRMDEKKFDVEGAYNARYEIIKKRVDKAHIKRTKERITQPGHIVIVYSQEQDANEYRTYLKFLASKGYLKHHIKDVALEDLQGVHGLRALRVAVDYAGSMGVDELIREIEEGTSAK